MAPLAFSDIPKSTNDLLNKDFFHGSLAALDVKTKAPNGVTFTVKGKESAKGTISGNLEAKYSDKSSGVSLTQSWATNNALNTKVDIAEVLTPGLKAELSSNFIPELGSDSAKLSVFFSQPSFNARAFFDLVKGPSFIGDATIGHDGFIAGGEVGYNVLDGRITKYSAAIGYNAPLYTASVVATNNLSVFSASYYHRVNPLVEAGAKATWNSKNTAAGVGLEFATKYLIDSSAGAYTKAKINNQGIAALSYLQPLRPGVKLGLGLQVDTQRLNEAAHKVGFSLSFEG